VSDLVEAAKFNTAVDAELARTFLESFGLSSVVFDEQSAMYAFAPIGIRLMVLDKDLSEARKLLHDYNP